MVSSAPLDPSAAFEVRTPEGGVYRIWADGRVEGFGRAPAIINRIPALAAEAVAEAQCRP